MLRLFVLRSPALPAQLALLLALGGCGLVLDANTRDAAVPPDARGLDASTEPDAEVPDARGLDAPDESDADHPDAPGDLDAAFPPELDAAESSEPDAAESSALDAAHDRPEAGLSDATVDPALRDAGHDARPWPSYDAGRDSGYPDTSLPDSSLRDAGRDAGRPDANLDAACFCDPVALAGNRCQDTECVGGVCMNSGAEFACPPAGSCARPCARNAGGDAVCIREGTSCSPLLDACDSDAMCIGSGAGGARCVSYSSCPVRVCLPTCVTGTSCMFSSGGSPVRGMCTDGVCVPTSLVPVWC